MNQGGSSTLDKSVDIILFAVMICVALRLPHMSLIRVITVSRSKHKIEQQQVRVKTLSFDLFETEKGLPFYFALNIMM